MNRTIQKGSSDPKAKATPADEYKTRLLKLIPGEVVGAYLATEGIVREGLKPHVRGWLWVLFVFFLVATPLYQVRVAKVTKQAQVALATVAYITWVFAIGGVFATYDWYNGIVASLVMILITFAVPIAYTG